MILTVQFDRFKEKLFFLTFILLVMFMSVGCDNLEDRTKYLTGSDVIIWQDNSSFHIKDNEDMTGRINLSQGQLSITVWGFPPKSTINIGTETGIVNAEGYASIETMVDEFYGVISTKNLNSPKLDDLFFYIKTQKEEDIKVKLPATSVYGIDKYLAQIVNGPILFEGEEPKESSIQSIYCHLGISSNSIFGNAPTLKDIDAIAVLEQKRSTINRVCDGYVDKAGKNNTLIIFLNEITIKVFNRRTGKLITSKRFESFDDCPSSYFAMNSNDNKRDSSIPKKEISRWLNSLRK
ncbi:hypothetical protein [Aquimarina algicola]|uniref:Uncharacterized protein n=1 Tax=Aquimarina algicola TaxID=2589995 RepID=A0A504J7W7_9FLAO|nr:hypothetical protein [Aquimarina algicola]TPN84685.1 hypothetical protein FHK87_17310 [Aquimarina algicola]